MNDRLIEILLKNIVADLPEEKRQLYEYMVQFEDELAQQSETTEQFLSLLVQVTPHQKAAKHFNRSYGETMKLMQEIENEIDMKLRLKMKSKKWINCTDIVRKKNNTPKNIQYYLFLV